MKRAIAYFAFATLLSCFACRVTQPVTPPPTPPPGQTFIDVLSEQLKAINFQPVMTRDGDKMTVLVKSATTSEVNDLKQAMCRPGGWPFGDRVIRFDETLRGLRQEGVRRVSIARYNETLIMQIDEEGKCVTDPTKFK